MLWICCAQDTKEVKGHRMKKRLDIIAASDAGRDISDSFERLR